MDWNPRSRRDGSWKAWQWRITVRFSPVARNRSHSQVIREEGEMPRSTNRSPSVDAVHRHGKTFPDWMIDSKIVAVFFSHRSTFSEVLSKSKRIIQPIVAFSSINFFLGCRFWGWPRRRPLFLRKGLCSPSFFFRDLIKWWFDYNITCCNDGLNFFMTIYNLFYVRPFNEELSVSLL